MTDRTKPEVPDLLGPPNCPTDLVPMVPEGVDPAGKDARWVCPHCGLVQLAS